MLNTGSCQACSSHQPHNAFHQLAPDTKLQTPPAVYLLMPKYLLIIPRGKRALVLERNSYQTTWKIQIYDFLADLPWLQSIKMTAHFATLHFVCVWEIKKP